MSKWSEQWLLNYNAGKRDTNVSGIRIRDFISRVTFNNIAISPIAPQLHMNYSLYPNIRKSV